MATTHADLVAEIVTTDDGPDVATRKPIVATARHLTCHHKVHLVATRGPVQVHGRVTTTAMGAAVIGNAPLVFNWRKDDISSRTHQP